MSLRELERASIRKFLEDHADMFAWKRVLDFGCGAQPYRDMIVEAGAIYEWWDDPSNPGYVALPETEKHNGWVPEPWTVREGWDVIVCTQVIQFVPDLLVLFETFRSMLSDDGVLMLTGPTNWPVVEAGDLHRFTKNGALRLLEAAGFGSVEIDYRERVKLEGETWELGWWALARP